MVGQGFAEVLSKKANRLQSEFGTSVRITAVADSRTFVHSEEGLDPEKLLLTKEDTGRVGREEHHGDTLGLVSDLEYDVLVELTPTNIDDGEPGLGHMRTALDRGKDIITCNKGPLALKFRELADMARETGGRLRYEGSVGGAMPVLNLSREVLRGEEVQSIRGILNGTCNFILHRMGEEGLPLQQALREAQEMGIAEADASYDIDGVDSASKLAILANAIMDRDVSYHDITTVGIRNVTEDAVSLADEQKKVIRLIGEISDKRMEVSPRLVPIGHPLSIGGTLNMVQLKTDVAGEITVAGKGAGRMETASAVLSDLVNLIKENSVAEGITVK